MYFHYRNIYMSQKFYMRGFNIISIARCLAELKVCTVLKDNNMCKLKMNASGIQN